MSDKVFSIKDAAKFLNVAPEVIADLLASGELPGRQIAGEWRTTKRAILTFVDGIPAQQVMCCTPNSDGQSCC